VVAIVQHDGNVEHRDVELVVSRFDPATDEEPRPRSYRVPRRADWSVLDALNFVKDELDGSLSYRWSCRMEICGSCGMMIDGEPRLACSTFLRDHGETVRIGPLSHFPVVRDLVVEFDRFLEQLGRVRPWIIQAKNRALEDGPSRQSPAERAAFDQFSHCINCMLCYAACPVVAREPEFLGPAAIAIGRRYDLDSRDDGAPERRRIFLEEGGVFSCSYANECSVVCPKNVDPAAAIQQEKLASVVEWARSLVLRREG
jgi:fumarate reductase iron-sulfur subunit